MKQFLNLQKSFLRRRDPSASTRLLGRALLGGIFVILALVGGGWYLNYHLSDRLPSLVSEDVLLYIQFTKPLGQDFVVHPQITQILTSINDRLGLGASIQETVLPYADKEVGFVIGPDGASYLLVTIKKPLPRLPGSVVELVAPNIVSISSSNTPFPRATDGHRLSNIHLRGFAPVKFFLSTKMFSPTLGQFFDDNSHQAAFFGFLLPLGREIRLRITSPLFETLPTSAYQGQFLEMLNGFSSTAVMTAQNIDAKTLTHSNLAQAILGNAQAQTIFNTQVLPLLTPSLHISLLQYASTTSFYVEGRLKSRVSENQFISDFSEFLAFAFPDEVIKELHDGTTVSQVVAQQDPAVRFALLDKERGIFSITASSTVLYFQSKDSRVAFTNLRAALFRSDKLTSCEMKDSNQQLLVSTGFIFQSLFNTTSTPPVQGNLILTENGQKTLVGRLCY